MKIKKITPFLLSFLLTTGCSAVNPSSPTGQKSSNELLFSSPQRPANSGKSSQDSASSSPLTAAPSAAPPLAGAPASGGVANTAPAINIPATQPSPESSLNQDNFFKNYGVNPFVDTNQDHLSTFSIDVDTASYTWMRKSIENGYLPNKDSVRTEEYINYFDYNYPKPEKGTFSINMEMAPSLFGDKEAKLLRIGIQGKDVEIKDRKNAILTFVIDVSGSMNMENRLGLVKQSLEILLGQLRQGDKVGIVIYGTDAKVLLEPKSLDQEGEIINAIRALEPSGSTNAEAGLKLGYQIAEKYFQSGAINRVILCSDGVANVGQTGPDSILTEIKKQSESGINLSTIGFGMGNYNDTLMEQLANNGDGNYYYVDDLAESRRVFVENLTGTLQVIAKDTKIQVDFNKEVVKEYRLLGYENRDIADTDFRNDQKDAGEVGAGHSVTALYEIKLRDNADGKVAETMLRYKDVDNLNSVMEINKSFSLTEGKNNFSETSNSFQLATLVAEYAEILKQSIWAKDGSLENVFKQTQELNSELKDQKKVKEFISLLEKAKQLK